jgi:Nif-specific regulatory protein
MNFYQYELRRLRSENIRLKGDMKKLRSELRTVRRLLGDRDRSILDKNLFIAGEETRGKYHPLVGSSSAMQELFNTLDRVIETNVPVLIQGESGTGKELVAKAIHYNSKRAHGRFVSENCAAIPTTLLESELFGYTKGAFTGATRDKKGLFELASGGTLFLDEIGDMSEEMQKKLLRVLQEGEIRPVGAKDVLKVDVRIISASNKELQQLVEKGKFRKDLYYRINVITIRTPALREHREDIPELAEHFLDKVAAEYKMPRRELAPDVLGVLSVYDWPGNIREFENEIYRVVALSDGIITSDLLSSHIQKAKESVADWTKTYERINEQTLKKAVAKV